MFSALRRACLHKHSCARNKSTQILGLSFGSHDTAAALIIDGKVVAACEEERYTGEKHTFAFPTNAIKDCLKLGNTTFDKVDLVAHCSNFEPIDSICSNLLETQIRTMGFKGETRKFSHHLCHIANSYYSSGFDTAVVASFDGIGKFLSSVVASAKSGGILVPPTIESEPTEHFSSWGGFPYYTVSYPDSIGLLYSGVTKFLGFKELNDEGVVMGLASYGNPNNKIPDTTSSYIDKFREILVENEGMGFTVHPEWRAFIRQIGFGPKCYFDPAQWGTSNVFGAPRYPAAALLTQHKDIAAGLQQRIEEVVLSQLRKAKHIFGVDSLCLSGGVGLNCAMNGKILTEGIFKKIFVPAAPGDNGLALGAAYLGSRQLSASLPMQPCPTFYLGSSFTDSEIEAELKKTSDIVYEKLGDKMIDNKVAELLDQNYIIGYFQGRSEFGPRALGNRSILASSKLPFMNKWINSRVKFREEFRPFAPVVLENEKSNYYQLESSSWHMQYAVPVRSDVLSKIPATVHIDNTARVQTVSKDSNEKLYNLMNTYFALCNSPVLLNTSFNVKGQPIVNTPKEAIDCFISTNIDFLVLGTFFCKKRNLYYEKRQQEFEKFV